MLEFFICSNNNIFPDWAIGVWGDLAPAPIPSPNLRGRSINTTTVKNEPANSRDHSDT